MAQTWVTVASLKVQKDPQTRDGARDQTFRGGAQLPAVAARLRLGNAAASPDVKSGPRIA
jgi:hypothetical protein